MKLNITLCVEVPEGTDIKHMALNAEKIINSERVPEIQALHSVEIEVLPPEEQDDENAPVKTVAVICNRPSENAQWIDYLNIRLKTGEERKPIEEVLRDRIRSALATQEGWNLIRESTYDFNWADFFNNIGAFKPYGITDALNLSGEQETISVDVDEHLAKDIFLGGIVVKYDASDNAMEILDAKVSMETGEVFIEDDPDISDAASARFISGNMDFDLDIEGGFRKII